MKIFSRLTSQIFCAVALFSMGGVALAQGYPNKPVRIVVPWPAGGGADFLGRSVAQRLTQKLGQQVLVENRPGVGGSLGAAFVKNSAPDGYTLLMNYLSDSAVNLALYRNTNLGYDPKKDFSAVTQLATGRGGIVVVNPAVVPVNSIQELVALAKSKPGQLNYASGGSGSSGHLAGELLKLKAGINTVHIPYKGTAPALADILGGQVGILFTDVSVTLPHIKSGKLRALASFADKRSSVLPDVPTMAEAGVAGVVVTPWWGIVAPAGTPRDIIVRLNTEIIAILQTQEMKDLVAKFGADPVGNTPEQFAVFIDEEILKWTTAIKEIGLRAD